MVKENIDQLVFDEHNFNEHTAEGMKLLEKSIKENKFGRSILVDKNNNIIAGNGVTKAAKALGKKKIKIVDTDGDELIVVRRNDVDINTQRGREMALADNAISEANLKWNEEELQAAEKEWNVSKADWSIPEEVRKEVEQQQIYNALPPELQGVDLTPEELPKIIGSDKTAMERIIIVYPFDKKDDLARFLGLEQIEKVVYSIGELNI